MEGNYPKAYKEVIEILNYVPKESINKIPKTMLDTFKAKMDTKYDFKVDINKRFEEQDLLDETKAIFANIFRDYWATPYQKEKIIKKEKHDRQKEEQTKKERYNSDNIFNKKKNAEGQKLEEITNLPIEIKKEEFYNKIIKFFKQLFRL